MTNGKIETNRDLIVKFLLSVKRPDMDKLVKYLIASDFFTAPASTHFHDSEAGGLAAHSLDVYNALEWVVGILKLEIKPESRIIIGLLHDVCKIDFYKRGIKNVKEGKKINGYGKEVDNWIEKEVWEVADEFPAGHGEKSVFTIIPFISLTEFEILSIRWHMAAWDLSEMGKLSLRSALDKYPAIMAVHVADLIATYLTPRVREQKETTKKEK